MSEKLLIMGSRDFIEIHEKIHSTFFEKNGLGWRAEAVCETSKEEAKELLQKRKYAAVLLDTPFKKLGLSLADIRAASAKLANGAGLLVLKEKALLAFDPEGNARVNYLKSQGSDFSDALVVVCGAEQPPLGDVLAAALYGARKIVLVGENKQATKDQLERFVKEFASLAYATIELPPAEKGQQSFRDAYDKTDFSFASYRGATKVFDEADIVIDRREPADFNMACAYAVAVEEIVGDILRPDFEMSRKDMFSLMAAARERE